MIIRIVKCWISISKKDQQKTLKPICSSHFYLFQSSVYPNAKSQMFPIKNTAAAWGTYHDIAPDYRITPDCWSINGEQMNALLAPLCWNVSVSLCRTKGSITARPVSWPAGNELCLQFRYVTGVAGYIQHIHPWMFFCVFFYFKGIFMH